ncbi:transcriptional regulator [Bacteroides sp. GD17]|nr:transcriptional regulator [uncultured Bacteroides sp.]
MLEATEESCSYESLGEYIDDFRLNLGISVKQLCSDCHISRRTYYESSGW